MTPAGQSRAAAGSRQPYGARTAAVAVAAAAPRHAPCPPSPAARATPSTAPRPAARRPAPDAPSPPAAAAPSACRRARGSDLRVHFKNSREAAHSLRGLDLAKAKAYMQAVIDHKRCVPFLRYNGARRVGRGWRARRDSPPLLA